MNDSTIVSVPSNSCNQQNTTNGAPQEKRKRHNKSVIIKIAAPHKDSTAPKKPPTVDDIFTKVRLFSTIV